MTAIPIILVPKHVLSDNYPDIEWTRQEDENAPVKISSRLFSTASSVANPPTGKHAKICSAGFFFHKRIHSKFSFGNADIAKDDLAKKEQLKASLKDEEYAQTERFDDLYEDKEGLDLLLLDPAKWKDQDHYAVLGLRKMRYRATDDELKKAYRRKVLKYHPDKSNDKSKRSENFFKCVQKAYEFLSDPVKRKQYDSVDPEFDESMPSESEIRKHGFFKTLGPIFARNAHFSKKHPVPSLGDESSSREKIEHFYKFWTEFQSWRTFELMDDEMPNENDSRDERRWMEKQNKARRSKLLKEDRARLYKLVDLAINTDPRLAKFKEEEKAARNAKKMAKKKEQQDAVDAVKREKEAEENRLKQEADAKKEQEAIFKREKSERKNIIKSFRRDIRDKISAYSFFKVEADCDEFEVEKRLLRIFKQFGEDLVVLEEFDENMKLDSKSAYAAFEKLYDRTLNYHLEKQIEDEKKADCTQTPKVEVRQIPWSDEEIKLLIKAVNMFPVLMYVGGTGQRWEKIAEYIQQHSSGSVSLRKAEDIIHKSKEVRSSSFLSKASTLQTVEKKKEVEINDDPTVNYENEPKENDEPQKKTTEKAWEPQEQAKLESALRAYPASGKNAYKGADRWDRIAGMVEGRSKKEVLARVKEIVKGLQKK